MNSRSVFFFLCLTAALIAGPALAWQPDRGPAESDELHAAMQKYFTKRLRAELALSDEQFDEIVPLARTMEDQRRTAQRARMESLQKLRRGLEQGATDAELQQALDRLEKTERDHQESQRRMLEQIDRRLSTRQRVQLRFFTQQFRREIQEKVRELRGGREMHRRPQRRRP